MNSSLVLFEKSQRLYIV